MIHENIKNLINFNDKINTEKILNYIIEDIENNNYIDDNFYNSKDSLRLYEKLDLNELKKNDNINKFKKLIKYCDIIYSDIQLKIIDLIKNNENFETFIKIFENDFNNKFPKNNFKKLFKKFEQYVSITEENINVFYLIIKLFLKNSEIDSDKIIDSIKKQKEVIQTKLKIKILIDVNDFENSIKQKLINFCFDFQEKIY